MENQADLLHQFENYLQRYPDEHQQLESITAFVQQHDGDALYNRRNFAGHITASAFIYNEEKRSLLMIHHTTLKRWLQPGGHVEMFDKNIFDASLREAVEETGLQACQFFSRGIIFDIDSHAIPANQKKNEPAHTHHDTRFLFTCNHEDVLPLMEREVSGCKWIALDEIEKDPTFTQLVMKLKKERR
jgi:8-oxo-dGTP pyrophosphatase MutT (NUDIX family)